VAVLCSEQARVMQASCSARLLCNRAHACAWVCMHGSGIVAWGLDIRADAVLGAPVLPAQLCVLLNSRCPSLCMWSAGGGVALLSLDTACCTQHALFIGAVNLFLLPACLSVSAYTSLSAGYTSSSLLGCVCMLLAQHFMCMCDIKTMS
jgi:hypothetical protein